MVQVQRTISNYEVAFSSVAISDVTAQQNDISQRGVVPNADGDEIDIFVGQDIGPEASLVSEAASEESGIALPEIEGAVISYKHRRNMSVS